MKRLIALVTVALAVLAVAGCGTTEVADSPDSVGDGNLSGATSAPASDGSGDVAQGKATIGDTITLQGIEGTLIEITVKGTKRMPALSSYGMELHGPLYGVRLRIKNVGESVYEDSVSNCVALIDKKGETLPASFAPSDEDGILAGTLESVKIAPGSFRQGWTWFDVKKSQKPALFQYTPDSGFGETVGEWEL